MNNNTKVLSNALQQENETPRFLKNGQMVVEISWRIIFFPFCNMSEQHVVKHMGHYDGGYGVMYELVQQLVF